MGDAAREHCRSTYNSRVFTANVAQIYHEFSTELTGGGRNRMVETGKDLSGSTSGLAPVVSVAITSFNSERWLGHAIDRRSHAAG